MMIPGFVHGSNLLKLKIFSFLSFIFFSSNSANAQKIYSLQDCIEYAIQNNISIKQSEIAVEISDINYFQSKAALLPSVNGNSSYSYNFGRSVDIFTYEFTTQEIRSANFSLSGNLPVFNGLQLQNSLNQSRYEYLAGRENLQKIKNDIALNVAAAYLQALYSRESLKAANDRLIAARESRNRTEIMVDAGSMAQGNLLDAEAALAAEELAVINAENLLTSSILTLAQLLELKSTEGFDISDPGVELPDQSSMALSPDEIYNTALKNLPEFRASEFNIKSAEKGLSIAKGGRYPRLSLFGSVNSGYSSAAKRISGENVSFNDQIDQNFNKSLGISLSIPILNGWSVNSNIQRSRLGLENTRLNDQLVKNQAYKSIVQAHSDAAAALKRYQASEKASVSANESFVYAEKRYLLGLLSSIEFLNVRNNRAKAASDFLQAKYDFIFRLKILDFYLGKPLSF